MIAGGLGNIRRAHVEKAPVVPGAKIVVLGGPAMLIGLGGGAASSMGAGASAADLDFASVQRGNPEMQRRAQEVIDACWALGDDNPILLIHDVGAGGLSNAMPESVHDGDTGGRIDLRRIPSDEPGMSPLEIWCNEAQERYVLAIAAAQLAAFGALCERERCPFAVVGDVTDDARAARRRPAVRQRAGRHAARDAARQAAADDARRAAPAARRRRLHRRATSPTCARRRCACCACRRWPTRPS